MKENESQYEKNESYRLLNKETIVRLSTLNPWKSTWAIVSDCLMIIAAAAVCESYFSIPLYLLTWLFIGTRYFCLFQMMHESTHYRLFNNRHLNNWAGELCALPIIFLTCHDYRVAHNNHHLHTGTQEDIELLVTDYHPYHKFPKTGYEIFAALLKVASGGYLIGVISLASKAEILKNEHKKPKVVMWSLIRIGFLLSIIADSVYYGFFSELALYWLIPIATSLQLFVYMHTVAQHALCTKDNNKLTNSRNIDTNFIEEIFFSHNISLHLDHHLYPSVPFYNLPELHKELLKHPRYIAEAHITNGFIGLFNELSNQSSTEKA